MEFILGGVILGSLTAATLFYKNNRRYVQEK